MSARRSPPWQAHEIELLRELYPQGGVDALTDLLADRSWHAIHQKAFKLGLRCHLVRPAPKGKLLGAELERAIAMREQQKWSFERIGAQFGISESAACNAVMAAQCLRSGHTPAERDEYGRLTEQGIARLRIALKMGLKGIDIQLRLGLSAGRIALERRRYNADLKARGKALLPPPGGGAAYSGVKLTRAAKEQVESLFMQGIGSHKIHEHTGVSRTSITRIRGRLIRRLRRKGQSLPGCDDRGTRRRVAENTRFIPPASVEALRTMLLERTPVRTAARMAGIGSCSAYRLRDELAAELLASGKELPRPILPGRSRRTGAATGATQMDWPPNGAAEIFAFRLLLKAMTFDEARAQWRRDRRAAREAEAARPRSFEEQLARVAAGQIGIVSAAPRKHLEPRVSAERNGP